MLGDPFIVTETTCVNVVAMGSRGLKIPRFDPVTIEKPNALIFRESTVETTPSQAKYSCPMVTTLETILFSLAFLPSTDWESLHAGMTRAEMSNHLNVFMTVWIVQNIIKGTVLIESGLLAGCVNMK